MSRCHPLGETSEAQRAAVMETFTRALGVGCRECHGDDYTAETPNVRIARQMWDRFVRGLGRRDGGALYCDSCHAGRATFLDRSDARVDGALGHWMQASYVAPLVRRDGAPHDCATCHGVPFVGGFLADWAAGDDLPDAAAAADLGAPSPIWRRPATSAAPISASSAARRCSSASTRAPRRRDVHGRLQATRERGRQGAVVRGASVRQFRLHRRRPLSLGERRLGRV